MTRQQQFKKLCAELEKASDPDHPAHPSSIAEVYEKLESAKSRLAWFVYWHQDRITVKSGG